MSIIHTGSLLSLGVEITKSDLMALSLSILGPVLTSFPLLAFLL